MLSHYSNQHIFEIWEEVMIINPQNIQTFQKLIFHLSLFIKCSSFSSIFFCISLKSLEKNEFIAGVFSTWIINSQFILSRKAHVTFMFSTYKKYFYKAPVKSFGNVGKKGDEPETPTLFLIFSQVYKAYHSYII